MLIDPARREEQDPSSAAAGREGDSGDKLGRCHAVSTLKLIISHNEGIQTSN